MILSNFLVEKATQRYTFGKGMYIWYMNMSIVMLPHINASFIHSCLLCFFQIPNDSHLLRFLKARDFNIDKVSSTLLDL
jgi:hypothetical protein